MGVLTCRLFTVPHSNELERCALSNPDHIPPGSVGDHVKRIQIALNQVSNVFLAIDGIYGPKTANAVVVFKEDQTPPLRQPGQPIADNIVGIRTIQALDEQMFKLENAPQTQTGFISTTPFGSPAHDHNTNPACDPNRDSDDFQHRISHLGTPINPQGFGRKICIGGTNDVAYLGFENFVPDPRLDPGMRPEMVLNRALTSSILDHTCSDICMRSAPLDDFMQQSELKRLAMPGCRFTYADDPSVVAPHMPFFLSLGPLVQSEFLHETPDPTDPFDLIRGMHAVVISILKVR